MSNDEKPPPRLVDLILEAILEEWPNHVAGSTYYESTNGTKFHTLYIEHKYLGEVYEQKVVLWLFDADPMATFPKDKRRVEYHASDPKFFQHVVETVKLIIKRYEDDAEETLRNAKYFKII
jgi:hypothetical protein